MDRLRLLVFLAVLALFTSGCSKKGGFVGSWSSTDNGQVTSMTFNADKTMSFSATAGTKTRKGTGTWSATEKDLTITALSMVLEGFTDKEKAQLKPDIDKQLNVAQTASFTWKDPDTLVITRADSAQKFTRQS